MSGAWSVPSVRGRLSKYSCPGMASIWMSTSGCLSMYLSARSCRNSQSDHVEIRSSVEAAPPPPPLSSPLSPLPQAATTIASAASGTSRVALLELHTELPPRKNHVSRSERASTDHGQPPPMGVRDATLMPNDLHAKHHSAAIPPISQACVRPAGPRWERASCRRCGGAGFGVSTGPRCRLLCSRRSEEREGGPRVGRARIQLRTWVRPGPAFISSQPVGSRANRSVSNPFASRLGVARGEALRGRIEPTQTLSELEPLIIDPDGAVWLVDTVETARTLCIRTGWRPSLRSA